jgi:hypothetical protein
MRSVVADEAATCHEEQICVMLRHLGEGIESNAVHGHEDRGREMRVSIKLDPVGVVIIRHSILNYFHAPLSSFI